MLLATLLVVTLLFHQCDASSALRGVDITTLNEDASPIGHEAVRHLEETSNKRSDTPFFPVLLAGVLVNVFTLVVLLSLIPVLMSTKWSCFKSAFWVANEYLRPTTQFAGEYWGMRASSVNMIKTPGESVLEKTATHFSAILFPAVACGMIFATTLFLIIPESILFIQLGTSSGKDSQIEILPGTTCRFGVAVMVGFMLPLVLAAAFPRSLVPKDLDSSSESSSNRQVEMKPVDYDADEEEKTGEVKLNDTFSENGDDDDSKDDQRPSSSMLKGSLNNKGRVDMNYVDNPAKVSFRPNLRDEVPMDDTFVVNFRLATSVVVCDAVHNFFEGTFIGVAFLTCSYPTAICITIIALYSEISQEMASYFILTNCGGISIPRSLLLIFSSGLAVVVGALMIVSIGLGDVTIGVFLAFAAGVFLHLAAGECLPRVYSIVRDTRDRVFALAFFIIGAFPVGLTLLIEETCTN
eukprot:CAMPEP_0198251902 /NCGR_PEP_ID=MMETSP1447-20131203/2579_1 /TAXON_ID=420782 /ORGANISM="Chaetoceros dichaeta, Strain CCMP1751" /LENGTH=465 /DNA_ID=CAMNT_0043937025 /DNA_START=88 /DNA_END=1485 /DNA_ORIENTATION=+